MNSTDPPGTPIAPELAHCSPTLQKMSHSCTDVRLQSIPNTLAELLEHVSAESWRRHGRSFTLIEEWMARPAEQILLRELFIRLTMSGFRPFLREKGYLENTIVAYRKGLTHLRSLAISCGVPVDPEYKRSWIELMNHAESNYCMLFAEHFEAIYASPNDVPIEEIDSLVHELVRTGRSTLSAARKSRSVFLRTLRECGFKKRQPVASARDQKYGVSLEDLPEPLKSETEALKAWATRSDDSCEWHTDWDRYEEDNTQGYIELRDVTATKVVDEICRLYGFVKNICNKEENINSLDSLLREKIVRSYQVWMQHKRKLKGTGIQTRLGTLFSSLRQYPGASHINLNWVSALLRSIPPTPQTEVQARKSNRIVSMHALEAVPDMLRNERNKLIGQHTRADRSTGSTRRREHGRSTEQKLAKVRATRLVRIAVLAQQELIIRFLLILVWRVENLSECRILANADRPANLFKGPVVPKLGKDIPEWALGLIQRDPNIPLFQFEFSEEETKAGRPVMAVLPDILTTFLEEFLTFYRPILVCGDDPGTLFVNQFGNAISKQQIEEAVQEATLRYTGRPVNPHLFRDIYAVEYLRDPDNHTDYLTLSKILWHGTPEITIKKYAWIFNESIGTSAAGEWAEKRDRMRRCSRAGLGPTGTRRHAARIPVPPPPPALSEGAKAHGRR